MSSERRSKKGISVASQNVGTDGPAGSAAGRNGAFVFFLDMRVFSHARSFPGSWAGLAVQAARRQVHQVDRPHALLHRKVRIPGTQVGIAVLQTVLRGVILRGTYRRPTFRGLQRMN